MATNDHTVAWVVGVDVRGDPNDPAFHAAMRRMENDITGAISRAVFTGERLGVVGAVRVSPVYRKRPGWAADDDEDGRDGAAE